MEHHPKAGMPVKIANGPLKDKYYVVHDWYINQYQGKQISKLKLTHGAELVAVAKRGYPIDEKLVWGRLYPTMEWCVVHDEELVLQMQAVENDVGDIVELPPNVSPMLSKGKGKARMRNTKAGGSSGKEVASKTTETGSSSVTPAKKENGDDTGKSS